MRMSCLHNLPGVCSLVCLYVSAGRYYAPTYYHPERDLNIQAGIAQKVMCLGDFQEKERHMYMGLGFILTVHKAAGPQSPPVLAHLSACQLLSIAAARQATSPAQPPITRGLQL